MKHFWLMGIAAVALSSIASASECLHYDLPVVKISGRISRVTVPPAVTHSGDPQPKYAWYFSSTKPLCISPGPVMLGNLAIKRVTRFEILLPSTHQDLSQYLGREVRLTGSFIPTYIPHYHTNLTFTVESVERLRGP
jgi:hypothetical protein